MAVDRRVRNNFQYRHGRNREVHQAIFWRALLVGAAGLWLIRCSGLGISGGDACFGRNHHGFMAWRVAGDDIFFDRMVRRFLHAIMQGLRHPDRMNTVDNWRTQKRERQKDLADKR